MRLLHLIGQARRAERVRKPCQPQPALSYRHRYQCWFCKYEGVLAFEPDALGLNGTECPRCGLDNESAAGPYDGPAVIPGCVPSRIC
jgi:hypothetical protein